MAHLLVSSLPSVDYPTLQVPSLGRRLLCLLYDILLMLSVQFVGFWLPQTVFAVAFQASLTPRWLLVHLILLTLGYFAYCWCRSGQTLAMRTWKMRLVNVARSTDGDVLIHPLRPAQALLRFALAALGIAALGLGLWWALFDKRKQYLHDRLVGSSIIQWPLPAPSSLTTATVATA